MPATEIHDSRSGYISSGANGQLPQCLEECIGISLINSSASLVNQENIVYFQPEERRHKRLLGFEFGERKI